MILKGTHNSMSYLPPEKWWMWLLRPFARCQRKTLAEQVKAGMQCAVAMIHIKAMMECAVGGLVIGRGCGDAVVFDFFDHSEQCQMIVMNMMPSRRVSSPQGHRRMVRPGVAESARLVRALGQVRNEPPWPLLTGQTVAWYRPAHCLARYFT